MQSTLPALLERLTLSSARLFEPKQSLRARISVSPICATRLWPSESQCGGLAAAEEQIRNICLVTVTPFPAKVATSMPGLLPQLRMVHCRGPISDSM